MKLADYDIILVNTSAGKDSQVMLDLIVNMATEEGVKGRIVAVHCDLGRVEWSGTRELAERQAAHYGVRFIAKSRPQGDLLEQVKARRMWPSSTTRYCTSDHKRGQVSVVMTQLVKELNLDRPVRILNCIGYRAEESPARAKKVPFGIDKRSTNGKRDVYFWFPILEWTLGQIWAQIAISGVESHRAYKLGMSRLSCVFCIFAPRNALLIAGEHNPELLAEYVAVEKEIGHTFKNKFAIASIQDSLALGERGCAHSDKGCWNM